MRHYSGDESYPLRDNREVLEHLDEAQDALTVQKLQVEATLFLARALDNVAEALGRFSDYDYGVRGYVIVDQNERDKFNVAVHQDEPKR